MNLLKKTLTLMTILLALTSCSIFRVHKMDIQQGNIITPDLVSHLHVGMSREQVVGIMGTPMLTNTFTPNRIDYVYTYKPGYGDLTGKTLTLIFRNNRLQSIQGNMYSTYMQ